MFNWIRGIFCDHINSEVIHKFEWTPTFHTTNGLDDEDERTLLFECEDCDCRIKRTQFKSGNGFIKNYRDIE